MSRQVLYVNVQSSIVVKFLELYVDREFTYSLSMTEKIPFNVERQFVADLREIQSNLHLVETVQIPCYCLEIISKTLTQ